MNSIDFQSRSSSMDLHDHCHDYAHILLALSDSLIVKMDDKEYMMSSNHLGFIAPGVYHRCYCTSEIVMMNIPENMIRKGDLEILSEQTVIPIEGTMADLVSLIKKEITLNPNDKSLSYLYYFLYEKLVRTNGIKSVRYIKSHYDEKITISQLAELESYNTSYFIEWFHKKTGFTPAEYLRCIRINKAKELLQNSDFNLLDVALNIGYNSHSAFTRAFKEKEGVSPEKYRQLCKKASYEV